MIENTASPTKRGIMKIRTKFCATFTSAAICGTCFAQRMYTIAPIAGPAPSATTYNSASWISDDGTVIYGVNYDMSTVQQLGVPAGQCYISSNGKIQVFATPGYSCSPSSIYGVSAGNANANGQFVGELTPLQMSGATPVAFANLNGTFDPVGTQIPNTQFSFATSIDQNGNVVGYALGTPPVPTPNGIGEYALLASGGQVTQLPLTLATGIGRNGAISGMVIAPGYPFSPTPRNAALLVNGNVMNLGTLGGPSVNANGPESQAMALNNNGQVVGWSSLAPEDFSNPSTLLIEGFFWDGTKMNPIVINDSSGNPLENTAVSVNDSGEVVGQFYPAQVTFGQAFTAPTHALYYANGKAVDLNAMLIDPPKGLVLATANYINNAGQIIATAVMPDGSQPSYLLTPALTERTPSEHFPRP